ncbi:MAG: restriction endonuclease subunit S [Bacteroidaceae bacterium]|nr:restriction endonuclease subunit S [Bacteroidaceae bacterium]
MVEWKKLGEIMQIVRGASPRPIKNFITTDEDGVNWIKIGDVSPFDKYITKTNEKITKEGAAKSRLLHVGDFILSNSMSFGRPYILKTDGCIHDGWIAMSGFEKIITSGYLYEILNSVLVQKYWRTKANNGGAMTNLNSDIVRDTVIPIPSLSEQNRIVGILDTFTASIDNLKQQIEQRRKQYEYYRDQLLDLEGKEGVEMKKIGELFIFKNGLNKEKKYFGQGNPIVNYTDVYHNKRITKNLLAGRVTLSNNEIERFRVHRGDVFFTRTSETKEEVGFAAVMLEEVDDCTFSGFLLRARPITSLLLPEYCAYCFGSNNVRQDIIKYSTLTTRALTNGPSMSKIAIPVPSLSEQQRIVSILDSFEASIANLEQQLAQRQKQYEYYRNKLLTFE